MQVPKVAIVILNYNGKHWLQKFLPSVVATTYTNADIIIADNASTDDSVAFLATQYPQLQIINIPTNQGFAKGYNTALQQVNADYYVLLNSDVEVTPNWVTPIIELMESNATIAVCQPKLLSYSQPHLFEHAGASGGYIDKFGYPFARGRVFETIEVDTGQFNNSIPIFWASGAAFFIKASIYKQLGGLDEYFFAHQEEIDMCWRVQLAGYKVMVCPQSIVYHVGGGTLQQGSPTKTFLNFRNNLIMLAKNLPIWQATYTISFRFLLDAIAAYRFLFSGEFSHFKAVAKAHIYFVKWLVTNKQLHKFTRVSIINLEGVLNKSIVYNYFIKKKKTFTQITQL